MGSPEQQREFLMCGIVSPSVVFNLKYVFKVLLENLHTENISSLVHTRLYHILQTKANLHTDKIYVCFLSLEKEINLRLRRWLRQQTVFYASMRTYTQPSIPTWKDWLWRCMHAIPELGKLREEGSLLTRQSSLIFKPHSQCLPQNIRGEWLRKTPNVNLWSLHTCMYTYTNIPANTQKD